MDLRDHVIPRHGSAPLRVRRAQVALPQSRADVLPELPIDHRRWHEVLLALLDQHNHDHGVKAKTVAYKTQAERRRFLFAFFRELRHDPDKPFRLDPRCLRDRHIVLAVQRWVQRGLSAGTMQLYLSYLRVFAQWIGKPGLVRGAENYVDAPERIERRFAAEEDRSWTSCGLDIDQLIERVDQLDAHVGAQLRLCRAFGLRVKEAIMLQPHLAEVDGHLEVTRGTKGGRQRRVPIDSRLQREALEHARSCVRAQSGHMADPTLSLKQNYRRFFYIMESVGVARARLGVTAHGLRHQYANDTYESEAGVAAPVRGGEAPDRDTDLRARLKVAKDLGHGRVVIASAYLGGLIRHDRLQALRRASTAAAAQPEVERP